MGQDLSHLNSTDPQSPSEVSSPPVPRPLVSSVRPLLEHPKTRGSHPPHTHLTVRLRTGIGTPGVPLPLPRRSSHLRSQRPEGPFSYPDLSSSTDRPSHGIGVLDRTPTPSGTEGHRGRTGRRYLTPDTTRVDDSRPGGSPTVQEGQRTVDTLDNRQRSSSDLSGLLAPSREFGPRPTVHLPSPPRVEPSVKHQTRTCLT